MPPARLEGLQMILRSMENTRSSVASVMALALDNVEYW